MPSRIAIVGGGYIGASLARSLDAAAVILIEPRSHFVHAPAMIRAVTDPSLTDRALIPFDRLLKNGEVLRAPATGIDAKGVTLDDGRRHWCIDVPEVAGASFPYSQVADQATPDALQTQ